MRSDIKNEDSEIEVRILTQDALYSLSNVKIVDEDR